MKKYKCVYVCVCVCMYVCALLSEQFEHIFDRYYIGEILCTT